jgi:hypothetical protein
MNALVTLNLRDFAPRQTRESFQYAARRWGVEYVEITTPLANCHHYWIKAMIPTSDYARPFDRIVQLDCDMLIRSDCPSPFDLVPPGNIGVVSRLQPHRNTGVFLRWFRNVAPRNARVFGLTCYDQEAKHLNAGLILYGRVAHADLLREWVEVGRRNRWKIRFGVPEQFALSCLLAQSTIPVTWLPWQFNTLGCRHIARFPPGPMRTYVYHFNGRRGAPLSEVVGRYQWRV